jgi:hypothetical protein
MEIKINIPESWQEITLPQYLKFYNTIKPYVGTNEYEVKMLERSAYYFCNIDADVLHKLPLEPFTQITEETFNLINSSSTQELVKSFEIGNTKFGFIPSLDEITYGEYVDLVTYTADTWENISEIMAILYRPITKQDSEGNYSIQNYNGTNQDAVDLFKDKLTMDIVFGALSFFLRLQMDLATGILTFSKNQMEMMIAKPNSQASQILAKNGVSTQQLQSLQETISQSLTKLQG